MLNSTVVQTFIAEPTDAGQRLDHFLQTRLKQYSRARLQSWIKDGRVRVNGHAAKASAWSPWRAYAAMHIWTSNKKVAK